MNTSRMEPKERFVPKTDLEKIIDDKNKIRDLEFQVEFLKSIRDSDKENNRFYFLFAFIYGIVIGTMLENVVLYFIK